MIAGEVFAPRLYRARFLGHESLWQQGMKFTDVAHAVGFHDLAHADHAFTEIFGLTPSEVTDTRRMTLYKCGP